MRSVKAIAALFKPRLLCSAAVMETIYYEIKFDSKAIYKVMLAACSYFEKAKMYWKKSNKTILGRNGV